MLWMTWVKQKDGRGDMHYCPWTLCSFSSRSEAISFHGEEGQCKYICCVAHWQLQWSLETWTNVQWVAHSQSCNQDPQHKFHTKHTYNSSILSKPKNAPSISLLIPLRCIFNDFKDSRPWNVRLSTVLIRFLLSSLKKKKEGGGWKDSCMY